MLTFHLRGNHRLAFHRGITRWFTYEEYPRLIEGESELEALVEQLTHVHESHMPNPWNPNLTSERRSKLLNMIMGFEIEITDIQCKFKLSQNRPLEDQQRVIEELSQSSDQTKVAVAKLILGAIHAEFNNAINSDVQNRRFALLLRAGHGKH